LDDDGVGVRSLDLDVVGLVHDHLMGEAQVHDQALALLGHTVADALNFQLLLEAVHNALQHVGDVGAGEAVQAAGLFLVIGAGHQDFTILDLHGHQRMDLGIQGALGALHGNVVPVDTDLDARRNDDGFSSNSRHCLYAPFLPHKGEYFAANVGSSGSLVGHN